MYWKITEDLLWEPTDSWPTRVGTSREDSNPHRAIYNASEVRLLDDDRIHYYTAICEEDEDSLYDLFAWAQRDAGVTILQIKNAEGKWIDEIG